MSIPRAARLALGATPLLCIASIAGAPYTATSAKTPSQEARRDKHGDDLPKGAIARLGSVRLRQPGWTIALAFSPDGKKLAAFGMDLSFSFRSLTFEQWQGGWGDVRIWDAATAKQIDHIRLTNAPLRTGVFSADWQIMATVADDEVVRVWDTGNKRELHRFRGPQSGGRLAVSPDKKIVAVAASSKAIRLHDLATGKELRGLSGPTDGPAFVGTDHLAFSPNGKYLAAANNNNQGVYVWEVASGRLMHHLQGHKSAVWKVAFSPDSKVLVSSSHDQTIRFWDISSGKQLNLAEGSPGEAHDLAFSPDGAVVASVGSHGAHLWDPGTGKLVRCLGNVGAYGCVAFSPDSKRVAWSEYQNIRLADTASGKELFEFAGPIGRVDCVALSADGSMAATGGAQLLLWKTATGEPLPLRDSVRNVQALDFSTDGKRLLLGCRDQTIRLWDPSSGSETSRFQGKPGPVETLAFLSDGKTAVSFAQHQRVEQAERVSFIREKEARLWDVVEGKQIGALQTGGGFRVAVSPDREFLLAGSIFDLRNGQRAIKSKSPRRSVCSLAIAPQARWEAVAYYDQTVQVLEVLTGLEMARFSGIKAVAMAFSPNGDLLAAGGVDGTVRMYDVIGGAELARFEKHLGPVLAVAFSSDGHRLISGSNDTTALVWDIAGACASKPQSTKLSLEQLKEAWMHLAAHDTALASKAMRRLILDAKQVLPFAEKNFGKLFAPDSEKIGRWLADLDNEQFANREKATLELSKLGPAAEPFLSQALGKAPSAEARRRIEAIINKLPPRTHSASDLQSMRVLLLLEQIGTPDAHRALKKISENANGTMKDLAHAVVDRLERRTKSK